MVPVWPQRTGAPTHPHTGVGYLCEALQEAGIGYSLTDMRLGASSDQAIAEARERDADLVGVSIMSFRYDEAYDLVAAFKAAGYQVVVGGPHVSTLRGAVLREVQADFAVKYEGERALVDLCRGVQLDAIPNLIFRDGQDVIENRDADLATDLDWIRFPTYREADLGAYGRKRIPIITSRGCPYDCSFCPVPTVFGRRFRVHSADHVAAELRYWYDHGYRDFDFQDDNFTLNEARVLEICAAIERAGLKDLFLICGNGIRADRASRPMLQRMWDVGFRNISFGVESASPEVLRQVGKAEPLEDVERAIEAACEIGYDVGLFFIVGLPGETWASLQNSIDLAYRYPVSVASFYNLIPFPGTNLFTWATTNGFLLREPQEYLTRVMHFEQEPLVATPEFTYSERVQALKITERVMQETRRRDMERKLRGRLKALAGPVTHLVYSTPLNPLLVRLLRVPGLKRAMNSVLLRLNLRFYV